MGTKILENGRIPVMGNTDGSIAMLHKNLEINTDCQNKIIENINTTMIWPAVRKLPYPIIKQIPNDILADQIYLKWSRNSMRVDKTKQHVYKKKLLNLFGWTKPEFHYCD